MDPPERGVIPLDKFHVPASLAKAMKKNPYHVTYNTDFDAVIDFCAQRMDGKETWINPTIRVWYKELHRMGFAHSVECRDKDGVLQGGLYGIAINAAFFGESMFSRSTNASKIALVHLVERLKQRGYQLLDCQFVNDHLLQFGCVEVPRAQYHSLLESALGVSGVSFTAGVSSSGAGSSETGSC